MCPAPQRAPTLAPASGGLLATFDLYFVILPSGMSVRVAYKRGGRVQNAPRVAARSVLCAFCVGVGVLQWCARTEGLQKFRL